MKSLSAIIQMKAAERHFPVVLFIELYGLKWIQLLSLLDQ